MFIGTSIDGPCNSESYERRHSSEHDDVDEIFDNAGKYLLESRESFYDATFELLCFDGSASSIGLIDTGTSCSRNFFRHDNGCGSGVCSAVIFARRSRTWGWKSICILDIWTSRRVSDRSEFRRSTDFCSWWFFPSAIGFTRKNTLP